MGSRKQPGSQIADDQPNHAADHKRNGYTHLLRPVEVASRKAGYKLIHGPGTPEGRTAAILTGKTVRERHLTDSVRVHTGVGYMRFPRALMRGMLVDIAGDRTETGGQQEEEPENQESLLFHQKFSIKRGFGYPGV